jgi:uncharacterized membrane protein YkoI
MRHRTLVFTATMALLSLVGLGAAEKKIQLKDLPPAVQKAVQEETKGAKIVGVAREIEKGKTMYEVETIVNGHSRDLIFDAAGNLDISEETVDASTLPPAVKAAFEARGKILKAETVSKKGMKVTYEAQVQKGGKKLEVAVDADGKPIKP